VDVAVEDAGPCKKRVKITVPQSEIQKKIDESYERLRESAVIDGFRKGHVPRKLLERRFGEEVVEEVKQTLLAESSEKAIEENDLKVLGTPSFDDVDFALDKDCVFEITLEVRPEFELAEYKGLHLVRKAVEISDEEIESSIESLRRSRATLEAQPGDAVVRANDYVNCDWEITADGEMVASEKADEFVVTGKRFGGVELEKELPEILEGAHVEDRREASGKILDSYPIEKWRGKECAVSMTIREIRRPVLPEVDDAFAASFDFDSVDDLKQAVIRSIRREKERDNDLDLERQIFDQLLATMPFDLPEGLFKAQARSIMMRQQYRLRMRGIPEDELEKHLEELRDASEEAAERNLKIFFILEKICDKEKIFVTENEVENRIAAMANSFRVSAAAMRKKIEQEGSMAELRAGMREDKAIAFLKEHAQIVDQGAADAGKESQETV